MAEDDLEPVLAIADTIHGTAYFEPREVFAERLALFTPGCRIATDGNVLGYAIAHPAHLGHPPPLARTLGSLPRDADTLHLHDVVLLPPARGAGLGSRLVADFTDLARTHGLSHLSLIAVHGSAPFWMRHGFAPGTLDATKLQSYGDEAAYLTRTA